jgi:hypothetical protein
VGLPALLVPQVQQVPRPLRQQAVKVLGPPSSRPGAAAEVTVAPL